MISDQDFPLILRYVLGDRCPYDFGRARKIGQDRLQCLLRGEILPSKNLRATITMEFDIKARGEVLRRLREGSPASSTRG